MENEEETVKQEQERARMWEERSREREGGNEYAINSVQPHCIGPKFWYITQSIEKSYEQKRKSVNVRILFPDEGNRIQR